MTVAWPCALTFIVAEFNAASKINDVIREKTKSLLRFLFLDIFFPRYF
jgi:hypothetical protein